MNVFNDDVDYLRFQKSLYLFNDPTYRHPNDQKFLSGKGRIEDFVGSSERFVDVLAFCLLPNHFHLFLRQRMEKGISTFLHRISKGFARYFNLKNGRTGPLFDGRFGAVHIAEESQYEHIARYIHLNALDLTHHDWRSGKVADWSEAENFLEHYPWSSHSEFINLTNDPRITSAKEVNRLFPDKNGYLEYLKRWCQRYSYPG